MVLLQLAMLARSPQQLPPPDPSAVVFVLDDVGFDDLAECSAMGGTPTLDALAAAGRTYTAAYANPLCSPTRVALNFGRWHAGPLLETCTTPAGTSPPLAWTSLAELRPSRAVAMVGKYHMGGHPLGLPWECAPEGHGYEWIAGTPGNVNACDGSGYGSWLRAEACMSAVEASYAPQAMADAFCAWWPAQGGVRAAVVNLNLAHGPFHVPPAGLIPPGFTVGPTQRHWYLAMIAAYDTLIGQMLVVLDPSTLVFVVGDNGTPPGVTPATHAGKSKGTVYERGIHVPLIVRGLGTGTSSALVHVVDVYASVAKAWHVAGGDGLPLKTTAGHEFVLCGTDEEVCARSVGYKLRRVLATGAEQFFDLAVDPLELTNEIANPAYAALVASHRAWLDAELP